MNTDNKWLQQMSVKADYSMKSARKLLQVESNVNTDYSIRGATPLSCYPATFSAWFSRFFFKLDIIPLLHPYRSKHDEVWPLSPPSLLPYLLSKHAVFSFVNFTLLHKKIWNRADCQCSEEKIDTALFNEYWQEISATEHVNTEQCQY